MAVKAAKSLLMQDGVMGKWEKGRGAERWKKWVLSAFKGMT